MPFLWKSNTAAATSLHIPPSFDSVQSGVCIISLVPYANLPGPKYCSLTNPSFVFSLHTKHQSCFSTHATPQHPPPPTCTCTRTSHTPPPSLDTRSSVKLKAGWLEQQDLLRSAFAINILLFQMVPPITREAPATGPADRKGWGMADRTKWLKSQTFPRRWEARWQNAPLFDCYYRYVAILLQFSPHQCVYWSISAFVAKDIYHIRLKPFKSYLSVYIHLALKKEERNPSTEQQNDLVFLIPRNYVQISSRRTHSTTQMPTFKRRLWVIVWTGGILSLITRSQHDTAHNKQVDKFHSSFSLFLLCPLTVIPLPLSFSSGLRMRAEEEGCAVNNGGGGGIITS